VERAGITVNVSSIICTIVQKGHRFKGTTLTLYLPKYTHIPQTRTLKIEDLIKCFFRASKLSYFTQFKLPVGAV